MKTKKITIQMLEQWIGDDRPPFYLLEILVDLLNEKIKIKDLKQDIIDLEKEIDDE